MAIIEYTYIHTYIRFWTFFGYGRFAMGAATSPRLVFLLSRAGETETLAVGSSSLCVGRGTVVVTRVRFKL